MKSLNTEGIWHEMSLINNDSASYSKILEDLKEYVKSRAEKEDVFRDFELTIAIRTLDWSGSLTYSTELGEEGETGPVA